MTDCRLSLSFLHTGLRSGDSRTQPNILCRLGIKRVAAMLFCR
jgi:hypothetical protein